MLDAGSGGVTDGSEPITAFSSAAARRSSSAATEDIWREAGFSCRDLTEAPRALSKVLCLCLERHVRRPLRCKPNTDDAPVWYASL